MSSCSTRPSLALLCLVAAAACTDSSPTGAPTAASPIVNGSPTGNAYGSVGALLFDYNADGKIDGNDEWCTGSLISPTVFLTAAHCVADFAYTPPGSHFYVSFTPDLFSKQFKYVAATDYEYDPAYGHDQGDLHDLAVVILPASATKGMTVYSLPRAGELDAKAANGGLTGAVFINVGYGVDASRTGIPSFPFDGIRETSTSTYMALQPAWLGLLMNTSATGLGGDCYGDSGGPKFLQGGDPTVIYATVTTGDYNCRATTWDYRLDTPSARRFLGSYVKLP